MTGVDLGVEEPWELPEGWAWTRFGSVVSLRGEKVSPTDEPTLPFVGMDDIENDGLTIRGSRPFSTMKSAGNRFYQNDVLYGRLRPYLNKTAVVSNDGAASGELLVFQTRPGMLEAQYLQYLLHSKLFVNAAMSTTSGDRPRADFGDLAKFGFPLPPLAEQRRIVARIDALFAEIAEGEAALARARAGLETFRRALLKAAVTGELTREWREANRSELNGAEILLRLQAGRSNRSVGTRGSKRDISVPTLSSHTIELPHLPETWAWASLAQLGDFGRGKSRHRPRDDARLYGGTIPFIQTGVVANCGDFIDNFTQTYSDFGLAQSRLWPPGTLCITIAANIAKTGILKIAACFPDSIVGLIPDDEINPYFVHMWMQTVQKRIEKYAPATAQKNINLEVLEQVAVPVPPPAETAEILRRVSDTLAAQADTLALLDAEAADAARLRQSVLKAAFEGRLVPQDPTDEPARAMLERLAAKPAAIAPRRRGRPKRTER